MSSSPSLKAAFALTSSFLLAASAATCVVAYQLWKQQQASKKKDSNKDSKFSVPLEIATQASAAMQQRVALAIDLALQAGSNMVAYCDAKGTVQESSHDLGISSKTSPEDFCTNVDVENEGLITRGILATFPTHHVIGEESTGCGAIPPLSKEHATWIIDPIDGTTNFAAALPLTCVSIGYCEGGQPVMGVVYAPMTQELYVAVKGIGAFRNGARITRRSSSTSNNTIKLSQALVCFELGYPRDKESVAKTVGAVQRLMEHGCQASRQLGSGVLDLCYVASGRLDAVYAGLAGEGWKPWDYCAGYVIQHEAGCIMEAIDPESSAGTTTTTTTTDFDLYSKSHICAASAELVQEIRRVITQSR